jgi:hypothetical protein
MIMPLGMRTNLKKLLLALAAVWLGLGGFIFYTMLQAPEHFGKVMSKMPSIVYPLLPFRAMWTFARRGHLRVGDPAPDFGLATSDKKGHVALSSFRDLRPVVLVFGSYT